MRLDPNTFEVVKHRLWQINDEQGSTIRTIATSPIVVEGNNFNVAVFTRKGGLAVTGLCVLATCPPWTSATALFLASDNNAFYTGQWLSPNGGLFIG